MFLIIWDPFGARVDPLGPFQTRNDFLLKSTSAKPYPKRVPNCQKHLGLPFWILLDPFGPLWNVDKPAMLGHFCLFYWCAFLGHPVFYPNRWLSIRKWLQNDSLQIKPVEASRAWRDVIRQLHDKASPALKVRAAWKPFHTSVLIIICERVCQKGWISI